MKNITQRQLEYNIQLVKYENPRQKDCFDLTTIHSLLIDQNPKFIDLCQLITDYNSRQTHGKVFRPHLQRPFIERLYKMLSQLTRIKNSQNQLAFLNKIHAWAFNSEQDQLNENNNENNDKFRPGTASTKTRPYSAYTKKTITRPDSGAPTKQSIPSAKKQLETQVKNEVKQKYPKVDFKQLKHGQKQFFLGNRTLHPQQQRPRVKLKQFQRKVFYDEPDQEQKFKEFTQQKKPIFNRVKLPQIPLEQQVILNQEIKQGDPNLIQEGQNLQGAQGQEGVVVQGEQQANVEDLGVPGQQEQPGEPGQPGGVDAVQQQQVQVVDKLKPRLKVYGDDLEPIPRQNFEKYQRGIEKQFYQKNKLVKQVQEDQKMCQMMQQWAATKNRVKIQQRRRAQSARMMTKITGVPFQKYKKQVAEVKQIPGVFDLSEVKVPQIKSDTRPKTAFKSHSNKVYNQSLQNAITTGKIDKHLIQKQGSSTIPLDLGDKLGVVAAKPKKRTFQQILKQAQQKVNQQIIEQIEQVKQRLTNNRVSLGANKIYKSLSHYQPQLYEGEFIGQIIGQGMLNNPFFKVAKKKKKKKKGKK